jgi:hypothetical protein
MPTANQLLAEIKITLALFPDPEFTQRSYPENEWGTALMHYDVHIETYSGVNMETRLQSVRRSLLGHADQDDVRVWREWKERNAYTISIPHKPDVYPAMIQALEWLQNPPEPLRDCLVHLSEGKKLNDDDWFIFVQMYAEFISAIHLLSSWDASGWYVLRLC